MKSFLASTLLTWGTVFGISVATAFTADARITASRLSEISRPTNLKVRAAFNAWENYLNPNLCFPDSLAYKFTRSSEAWDAVILRAAKQASSNVESLRTLTHLATESDVRKAATGLLAAMGMTNDRSFGDKLYRVFQKVRTRLVFEGTTESAQGHEGRFIAIADLENNELVLLTDGDAFLASRCED